MTKTEFSQKLKDIVKHTRLGKRVEHADQEWLLEHLRTIPQYSKVANSPGVWVTVENVAIKHLRKVKMLVLRLRRLEIPLPKQRLLQALFPARDGVKKNPRGEYAGQVRKALRGAIRGQVELFRQGIAWPILCPLTGKLLYTWQGCDTDHTPSLVELADRWVEQEGLRYRDIRLKGPKNAKYLADVALAARWDLFHKQEARLAVVDASANRAKGCGDYIPRDDLL